MLQEGESYQIAGIIKPPAFVPAKTCRCRLAGRLGSIKLFSLFFSPEGVVVWPVLIPQPPAARFHGEEKPIPFLLKMAAASVQVPAAGTLPARLVH